MLNKVIIEGEIDSFRWSSSKVGFYVSIKQHRMFGKTKFTDYFMLYANKPLSDQLEAYVKEYKTIAVEGVLRTYQDYKTKQWRVAIEVLEIIINK